MSSDLFLASNALVDQRPFGSWKALIVENNLFLENIGRLFSLNIYGVNFITDSLSLYECMKLIFERNENAHLEPVIGCFYHFVYKRYEDLGLVSRNILTIYMGDNIKPEELLFVLPDLKNFISFEIESFSSVLGNIFGARSFLQIGSTNVGMHSSTLLDTKSGCIHMILGQTTSGKSSCAYLIEQISNKRFLVVSDDWSEVNLDRKKVVPFRYLLGEPRNDTAKRYLHESGEFKKVDINTSKTWYIRKNYLEINNGNIGSLFQLDVKSRIKNESYIFRKNNAHIPFMNVNFDKTFSSQENSKEKDATQNLVIQKISNLVKVYENISNWDKYHLIDAGSGNMELIAKNIYAILARL